MTNYERWVKEKKGVTITETANQEDFENRNSESKEDSEWIERQVDNEMINHD